METWWISALSVCTLIISQAFVMFRSNSSLCVRSGRPVVHRVAADTGWFSARGSCWCLEASTRAPGRQRFTAWHTSALRWSGCDRWRRYTVLMKRAALECTVHFHGVANTTRKEQSSRDFFLWTLSNLKLVIVGTNCRWPPDSRMHFACLQLKVFLLQPASSQLHIPSLSYSCTQHMIFVALLCYTHCNSLCMATDSRLNQLPAGRWTLCSS